MNKIYGLTILGNLRILVIVILILLLILGVFVVLRFLGSDNQSWNKDFSNFFKKYFLITGILSIVFCFLPSKQDLLAIYSIGGTIDYIQNNDKAKELPDKVVDALTEYLDNVNKDKDESN